MLVKFVKATLENDMLPSVVKYECDKVHALISLSWFVKCYFKLRQDSCMRTCGYIYVCGNAPLDGAACSGKYITPITSSL